MTKEVAAVEEAVNLIVHLGTTTNGAKANGIEEDGMIKGIAEATAGISLEPLLRMTSHRMINNGMIPETVGGQDPDGRAEMKAGTMDGMMGGKTTTLLGRHRISHGTAVEAALSNKKKRKISTEKQYHGPHMEYRSRPHLGRTGALVEARHLNRQKAKTHFSRDQGSRCHRHHTVTEPHSM